MKIITMKRLTIDGKPLDQGSECDPDDYFCVIETQEEEMVYDLFTTGIGKTYQNIEKLWNNMVKHAGNFLGLLKGDDDIYAYLRPDESCPDILEKYTDPDGDVWVRVE